MSLNTYTWNIMKGLTKYFHKMLNKTLLNLWKAELENLNHNLFSKYLVISTKKISLILIGYKMCSSHFSRIDYIITMHNKLVVFSGI